MPIEFNCPSCLKGYRVADSNVGKRVKCKSCGNPMTVPDLSGLTLADDTREVKRPPKRHSSTKILPQDRPRQAPPRNIPSDTARLTTPEPESTPAPRLPGGKLPPGKIPATLQGKPKLAGLRSAPTRAHAPENPKMRRPGAIFLLGAAGVIVGFFLPLFSVALTHFEGAVTAYELPWRGDDLAAALVRDGVYADNPVVSAFNATPDLSLVLFALYLIPVLALYGVVDDIRCAARGKGRWYMRLLAALGPVIAFGLLYLVLREPVDAFLNSGGFNTLSTNLDAVAPGTWVLSGGWLLLLAGVVLSPRAKSTETKEPA